MLTTNGYSQADFVREMLRDNEKKLCYCNFNTIKFHS